MANVQSLSFNASGYAIMPSDSASLSITGNYTFESWFKITTLPSSGNFVGIMAKSLTTGDQRGYAIQLFNDGGTYKIRVYANAVGDAPSSTSTTINWTPSTSTWYHLATTYTASSGTAELFINGASQGTGSGLATSNLNNTAFFMINSGNNGSDPAFAGSMDDVRMWNTIRTSTEISSNRYRELTGGESGLQGYWRLNGNYTDLTANGNNLGAGGAGNAFSTEIPFTDSAPIFIFI